MTIEIQVESPGIAPRVHLLPQGAYTVGNRDCDLILSYPTVSRHHGRITIKDDGVCYLDEGSRNGSSLDGIHFKPRIETIWPRGGALAIGPFLLQWRPADATPLPDGEDAFKRYAARYSRLLNENPLRASELLRELAGTSADTVRLLERIHREFHGDGPLHDLLQIPNCREILLNSHDEIYADLGDGLKSHSIAFTSRETFEAWAARTAHLAGRRLDLQHPICEATLPNGSRFHAVMCPVSAKGLSIAIRRFGSAPLREDEALQSSWLDHDSLAILKQAVERRLNIVISGGTSTGKTSLLNFLCQYLAPTERVITVEDTVELAPPVRNLVQLQARVANADGIGEISLRQLVQCALRLRPDRIIVGECRGAEVLDMLQALNTGHPGSLTTVHANSPMEAIQRLELLTLLGAQNLSAECVRAWIMSSVNLVVQVERAPSGHRHIAAIILAKDRSFNTVYEKAISK